MTLDDRIEELRTRHRNLDHEIDRENQRPHPDEESLAHLKRQKLRVKDELFQLEHPR
jgi:hypothetical protein